ncbi:MAG: hypothetical protein R3C01_17990 [Planctomycetaceae bacterium]
MVFGRQDGLICVAAILSWTGVLWAEGQTQSVLSVDGQPNFPVIVRQLGAESFSQREEAARRILEAGPLAIPQLEQFFEETRDLEIRARISRLRFHLRHAGYEQQLAPFLNGVNDLTAVELPAWNQFSEIVGDSPETRELYALMLRKEPELLTRIEAQEPGLGVVAAERIVEMISLMRAERLPTMDRTLALLFALISDTESHYPIQSYQISVLLTQQGEFATEIRQEAPGGPLRKLAGAWVTHVETATPSLRMSLAQTLGLEVGVEPALELLRTPGRLNLPAVLTLARFGEPRHVVELEGYLEDATQTRVQTSSGTAKYDQKAQDVALVAMLHLTGQDPSDYGFYTGIRTSTTTVYVQHTIGFKSDDDRQAAIRKWRDWRDANEQRILPAPINAIEGIGL